MDRDACTEDGWRAFEQASVESRLLGPGYLGTEHLLLGVLAVPDSVGPRALAMAWARLGARILEGDGAGRVREVVARLGGVGG